MDLSDIISMSEESTVALHSYLERCSIACIDDHPKEKRLSSGTLVEIGDRLLVATAAHAIPDRPSGRLWVIGGKPQISTSARLAIVKSGKFPSERPDIGFLELDKQAAAKLLGKQPCTLDSIADLGWGRSKRLACLMGAPSEWSTLDAKKHRCTMLPYVYTGLPAKPDEWEKRFGPFGSGYEVDPAIDVILPYVSKEQLPHLGGTSGGGIWDQGFHRGKLWHPEKSRLFAVQTSWCEKKRYLRGVQIVHWLRLIHRHYPDLRSILVDKFPQSNLDDLT